MKSSNSKKFFKNFLILLSLLIIILFVNNTLSSQTNNFTRTQQRIGGTGEDYGRSGTNITGPASNWNVPITVTSSGTSIALAFAGDANATNGFDTDLDVPAAPPGMTYYAYFETVQFPNYLSTDIRAWIEPYNADIDWTLKIVNATGKTTTVSWNPSDLPAQGKFSMEATNLSVDMKTQNSATFNGDQTLIIQYRPVEEQKWLVPLTISSNNTNLTLGFGGDPQATNGFDAGIDVPAAPPGMTYYAYFEISQFPNFLSTDIRAWTSPFNADIDWTFKIVNALNNSSTITWDSDKLPLQGTFTLEGLTSTVNMRDQSSLTFTGDKMLTIKYRFNEKSIIIAVPNGGEIWAIGSTQNITWTSNNFTDPVKIDYSIDGGNTWIDPPIVNTTPNDGSYPWVIPEPPSLKCKVRISNAENNEPMDTSDDVFAIGNVVEIWPPADTTGTANSIKKIPIYVRDVTNKGILGVELAVNTFPEVLKPLGATTEGTIASSWGSPTVGIVGGDIAISMAGASQLIGDEKQALLYIRYQIGNTLGAESPMVITKAMFNEGQPIALVTNEGKFKIVSKFNITGKVNYYYNVQFVPQALMTLTGYTALKIYTDALGNYQFNDLQSNNYVLKSTKNNDVGNAISSYDASLVLRYSVGSISLNPYQMIAADVSGNNEITSYDASYILRYCVNLISQFPIGKEWAMIPKAVPINETNWHSAPDSLEYKPLDADRIDQDFSGIVYGDVSGNWPGTTRSVSNIAVIFNIGTIQKTPEDKWLVPLEMDFSEQVYSGTFMIMFDESNLRFVSSSDDNPTSELLHAAAVCTGGINCAFASAQSVNRQESKISLLFEELNPVTPSPSDFKFANIIVDDKTATITVIKNQPEIKIPIEWQLSQNHPNPFNSETSICYQVPEASHVKIEIFNLLGQHLKTLVNENKNAGTFKLTWNGKNEQGRFVGSGIFICRMQAKEFTDVKKIVLIQ